MHAPASPDTGSHPCVHHRRDRVQESDRSYAALQPAVFISAGNKNGKNNRGQADGISKEIVLSYSLCGIQSPHTTRKEDQIRRPLHIMIYAIFLAIILIIVAGAILYTRHKKKTG